MYKIVFEGQLVEGFAVGQVKKNLAKLFKLSDDRAAAIFSGQAVVLKKNADAETAKKYKAVLHNAGASVRILPMAKEQAPAANATPAAAPPVTKTATTAKAAANTSGAAAKPAEQSWSLSEANGEPLLRAEERQQFVEREIDLSHINLVSSFLTPDTDDDDKPAPPPAVNTSHISVAEVGATIDDGSNRVEAVEVAELHATLAEVGATIGDGSSKAATVAVADLNATLAPVGSELGDEKPEADTPEIDISHLHLSE